MDKENFIELLNRSTPNDIVDYIKAKGKGPKSVCPITFYDEKKPKKNHTDTDIKNYKNAEVIESN